MSCIFGNLSVILVGDSAQSPPIANKPLYYPKPTGDVALQGFHAYQVFRTVITHKVNKRANDESEENFRKLLINLRTGECSKDDWKRLFSRNPCLFIRITEFSKKINLWK